MYQQPAIRVVFGVGSITGVADEVVRLGAERALVLATPEQRDMANETAGRLGVRSAGVFANAVQHVPIEVARAARAEAGRLSADCCIAVGGGSTIGLGKAIALDSGLPIIAIPTTYAGSEMTPIYGLTENGLKRTGRDAKVLPRVVLYDPALTVTLPTPLSGTSGMNAIAHCVEALYAPDANPIISLLAEEGIRAFGRALPAVVTSPEDLAARAEALYGAWLGGTALGATSMSLHHKLCHTLGCSFNLPHADVHAVVLPYAAAYNSHAAAEAMRRVAHALSASTAPQGLYDLAGRLGAPRTLREIGMPEDGLDRAAALATEHPYFNPRPIDYVSIRALLDDAFYGRPPDASVDR